MSEYYEWFKVVHIVSIIAWMAGLLYLPRLYVYHTKVAKDSESDNLFKLMELRLLRYIMNPSMIFALISGTILSIIYGLEAMGPWFHIKMGCVALLAAFHGLLARWRKSFYLGENNKSERFYRIINEVPTILLIIIVSMVIVKPFD